jgi:hypothetical protein
LKSRLGCQLVCVMYVIEQIIPQETEIICRADKGSWRLLVAQ